MTALNGWDIVAAVAIALVGNGFLSTFLLQRDRAQQEGKLERAW